MELLKLFYSLPETGPFLCAGLFLAYVSGLLVFYLSTPVLAYGFSLCIILLFIGALFFSKLKKLLSIYCVLSLYIIFICGFLNARIHNVYLDEFSKISDMKNVEITGVVYSIPKYNEKSNNYKFPLKVKTAIIGGKSHEIKQAKILVVVQNTGNSPQKINYADTISIKGTLNTPGGASNPSQFDYKRYLNNKGILKILYAKNSDFKLIAPVEPESFNTRFVRTMYAMRDKVIEKHSKYIKSPKLELLGGVVFGDEAVNSPDEVKDSFANSGLLHLLAASGLNVAFILSMWFCIIYFFNTSDRFKILSGIFMVFLYTVMTGFPPSIVRASVMLILVLSGKLICKKANNIALIFTAGFLILLFKPQFLCDAGFQLSFLVTLGLIICTPALSRLLDNQNRNFIQKIGSYPKPLKSFLAVFSPVSTACIIMVPLAAQFWAGPLQAYYFNTFCLYSIPANIIIVPFIAAVSSLGFISAAICLIPFIGDVILPVFDFILNIVIHIVLYISDFFAALPNSLIKVPSPTPLEIFCFYIFITFLFASMKFLFKRKILNICAIISFLLLAVQFVNFEKSDIEITFFDAGNADNCLIKTPKGKYILIDTGRYINKGLSSAKTITLEYFYDKNIRKIDTLIVTHFDSDHSGGLLDILKNIKVEKLIMPKTECTSKHTCAIQKYINENNIEYILPYTGQHFSFEPDIELVNLVPDENKLTSGKKRKKYPSRNDKSTVTFLKAGDYKFLFMADAPARAYKTIEKYIPRNIDVLKVAHHGAKNTVDLEMLAKLRPEFSIISTGKNRYNHPSPITIAELTKFSTPLSTAKFGAIKFKFRGFNPNKYINNIQTANIAADVAANIAVNVAADIPAANNNTKTNTSGKNIKNKDGNKNNGKIKAGNNISGAKNQNNNNNRGEIKNNAVPNTISAAKTIKRIKNKNKNLNGNEIKTGLIPYHFNNSKHRFTPIEIIRY